MSECVKKKFCDVHTLTEFSSNFLNVLSFADNQHDLSAVHVPWHGRSRLQGASRKDVAKVDWQFRLTGRRKVGNRNLSKNLFYYYFTDLDFFLLFIYLLLPWIRLLLKINELFNLEQGCPNLF
jgi:hypothetical protein